MSVKEVKVPPKLEGVGIIVNFYSHWYPEEVFPTTHRIYHLMRGGSILLTLSMNLLTAAILDSINFIHAVTLRWALFHEQRLRFNSNVRLFTRSKCHGPNSWYFNVISAKGLAISYGALSCIMMDVTVESAINEQTQMFERPASPPQGFVVINFLAVTALGVGLLLQVCISSYSLICSQGVLTWSNNPLANAKAISGYQPGQSETSVKFPFQLSQDSMLHVAPEIRSIRHLIWGFCGLFTAWSLGQGTFVSFCGYMMKDKVLWAPSTLQYWKFYGAMYAAFDTISKSPPYWLGLLIQIVLQSFLTLALHYFELLFNLSRDEAAWRDMENGGSKPSPSILSNLSRQTLFSSMIKSTVQWIFGYAFTADLTFNIALLPIVALMVVFILLTILMEYIIKRKPKGSIPASYGNFGRILRLVDEWNHRRLFWGDKGELMPGLRRAGTAGRALAGLQPGILYCCSQATELETEEIAEQGKLNSASDCDAGSDGGIGRI